MRLEFSTHLVPQVQPPSQGIMISLTNILNRLNPFKNYYEYRIRVLETQERLQHIERAERQEEKAAFLAALQSITTVAVESSKASQAQANALSTFLDSFKAIDTPKVREWDEDEANRRYVEKHMPAEMQGLDNVDRFQLLLDKVEENWLDQS